MRLINLHFSIFNLQFSIFLRRAVSARLCNGDIAQQKRASSSLGRFSRTASLLYLAAACPLGGLVPKRKTNREKSLREKSEISSGGIIGIVGRRIKAG
jgi:hypothetical protein